MLTVNWLLATKLKKGLAVVTIAKIVQNEKNVLFLQLVLLSPAAMSTHIFSTTCPLLLIFKQTFS